MMKGSGQILSGCCPNPQCQKKLFFPDHEPSIECSGCGQRHIQSNLHNLERASSRPGLVETIESLLLQLKKIDASSKKILERETYKINGLSNYLCTILSPLLTSYGMDRNSGQAKLLTEMGKAPTFDCGQLCDRSFLIDLNHLNVTGFGRDRSGSSLYLRDTLNVIKLSNENEERLIPIHADGDGHCLLHSVSRALVGWELFWHPLRVNLKQHFIQNQDKYKMQFEDFIDDNEWKMIIEECDPDFIPSSSEMAGLRNIHIFGLANVLKRPIILLDSIEGMQSSGDYSAIFLPVFSPPTACKNKDGVLNTPLCIAWSSLGRNHFIPLVGVKGKKCPVLSRHMIQRAWGVSDIEIDKYVHFENGLCQIGGEKGLQIGYVNRLVSAMGQVFQQQHEVSASLVADVYQHIFKAKGLLVFGVNLAELLDTTKRSVEEKQLYVCLACHCLALSEPLEDDSMCLPGGELYDLAISCHGTLKDGQNYRFPLHDIIAKYDKEKDCLFPVKGSRKPSGCMYCTCLEFRLVNRDYTVLYENGDRTQVKSSVCSCGFKHYWNGGEYDTVPKQILVVMEWGGRTVKKVVPWFQNETDPALNSNVYQMAQELVQKSFPGEFGSERLVQKVVDQILLQTDTPSKLEELKSLDQNHHGNEASTASPSRLPPDQSRRMGKGGMGTDDPMDVVVDESNGQWSADRPSKAIITGRQTQSIHKEELNKSNVERNIKHQIEKNAEIQQRKSSDQKSRTPNPTGPKSPATPMSSIPPKVSGSSPSHTPPPLSSHPPSSPSPSTSSPSDQSPATTTTANTKSADKRIRLATSDGRNITLNLPAECTFLELQALISKHADVPPEKQKIRHGFPPVELKPPSADQQDYQIPVQPGERIMLDIISVNKGTSPSPIQLNQEQRNQSEPFQPHEPPHVKSPLSAWSSLGSMSGSNDGDEMSDRVALQGLMESLFGSGGDNLDRSLSTLALTAAVGKKDLWTYVQGQPHLFSIGGLFYKQMERDMGLEHGKHCTLPLLPHKVFVYNAKDDRLELCLEPYGHFPIENNVESRTQSLLPTSHHCRSKSSHTPFSGQGHSLRSVVSSQDTRMPTDVPMSPKRMEARRLSNMCDPCIHQESIEEEDEEIGELDNTVRMDDQISSSTTSSSSSSVPLSSHQLRPDELTRPPIQKGGINSLLLHPSQDTKLIRKGPGYSELSPIPENSSNENAEVLHQLVSRIEQAVKSMGQADDNIGSLGEDRGDDNASSSTVSMDAANLILTSNNVNPNLSSTPQAFSDQSPTSALQNPSYFPSASAMKLSSSLMSGANSSSNLNAEKETPMAEESLQSLNLQSSKGDNQMDEEDCCERNRVAVYADEVATSIQAMDSDLDVLEETAERISVATSFSSTNDSSPSCGQTGNETRVGEEEEEMDSSDSNVSQSIESTEGETKA